MNTLLMEVLLTEFVLTRVRPALMHAVVAVAVLAIATLPTAVPPVRAQAQEQPANSDVTADLESGLGASGSLAAAKGALSLKSFQAPPQRYGPWTRWYWPGADVEASELRRELRLFKDKAFAGVEIQAFTAGILPEDRKAGSPVLGYGTERFYESVRVVMEKAEALGLGVDLTSSSGWPTGGSHIALEENTKTLAYGDTTVSSAFSGALPEPRPSLSAVFWGYLGYLDFHGGRAELLEVVAAEVLEEQPGTAPVPLSEILPSVGTAAAADLWDRPEHVWTDYVRLDPSTLRVITDHVRAGRLRWQPPREGTWQIIAVYAMPVGGLPSHVASRPPGYVMNPFDSTVVTGHYRHLFGPRTGLAEYYDGPFRAIFIDSFEFKPERHYAEGIFEAFRERRGYDLRRWLPAVFEPGYDSVLMDLFQTRPPFVLGRPDTLLNARIQYDYSRTISELFLERFLKTSRQWAERRGLKSRVQTYGVQHLDVIKAAGQVHIPETETLHGGGSALHMKLVSSGAHLYGRPVVSAESFVYRNRAYMTTPQKMKVGADKLFTAGVNQIIHVGTPYRWDREGYGETGWYPFSGAVSSNVSEASPFWPYQGKVNRYISRAQYLLRQGEPEADVLVYYPFLGVSTLMTLAEDHEELLFDGQLPGVDPPVPAHLTTETLPEQVRWMERVWPMVQVLERKGYTWDWINDESLAAARWKGGAIEVRGQRYQAVLIPGAPWMRPKAAESLAKLAEAGAAVAVFGEAPQRQPGFRNRKEGDREVAESFERVLAAAQGRKVEDLGELAAAAQTWPEGGMITYAGPQEDLRHIRLAMPGGAELAFLRSKASSPAAFALEVSAAAERCLWLDPTDGKVYRAKVYRAERSAEGRIRFRLAAYGSMGLLCGPERAFSDGGALARWAEAAEAAEALPVVGTALLAGPDEVERVRQLRRWDLTIEGEDAKRAPGAEEGRLAVEDTLLFDWRERPGLKHVSSPGVYRRTIRIEELEADKRYVLDLGKVYFVAEVQVNGGEAGTTIFAPHQVDITEELREGENEVTVKVVPSLRNRLVGKGLRGAPGAEEYAGTAGTELPAGLVGPATLKVMNERR